VIVTDTLPLGVTFVSASSDGWDLSVSGQTLTFTLPGVLDVGTAPVITIEASVHPAVVTLINSARVKAAQFDKVIINNTVEMTASVTPPPSLPPTPTLTPVTPDPTPTVEPTATSPMPTDPVQPDTPFNWWLIIVILIVILLIVILLIARRIQRGKVQ
jgi:hypothetical protein